ncbi:hypothetical protein [Fibrobacter sp.]|uniref:hypothetical protein n=1 Tax=Fibrobacter sp. TaxID=35828 RepID=UPI00386B342D
MFSKKILFPMAAIAMASFVACGDDSSSGSPASDAAPASIQKFEEIDDVACSQTVNLCAKVYLVEHNDTLQCNGSQWNTMINGKPVAGCENAAPAGEEPAAGEEPGAAEGPAAGEEPGAAEDPVAGEEPGAAEGPAAGEEPGAAEGPAAGEEPGAAEGPAAGEEPGAAEGPAAGEGPAGPGAGEEPAGPGAGEQPVVDGPSCYMASDIPGMASCLPITQEECATYMGEWVETCPVNN